MNSRENRELFQTFRWPFFAFLLVIFTSFFQLSFSLADASCSDILKKHFGAAIESELDFSQPVRLMMTTADGKVASIVEGIDAPKFFTSWLKTSPLKKEYPNSFDIPWDRLPSDIQEKFILWVYRRDPDKGKSPFPGFVPRSTIRLRFSEETIFLGRTYAPGTHTVNLGRIWAPEIDREGTSRKKGLPLLEFKIRSDEIPAGELLRIAALMEEGSGLARTGFHGHVLGKIPIAVIRRKPTETGFMVEDYTRRFDTYAEMNDILFGKPLKTKRDSGLKYWGQSTFDAFFNIGEHFVQLAKGIVEPHERDIGSVSFRGLGTYDDPNLFGLEYRTIRRGSNLMFHSDVLNRAQQSLDQQDFGFSRERFEKWKKFVNCYDSDALIELSFTHYGSERSKTLIEMPYAVRSIMTPMRLTELALLERIYGRASQMLVFDWSKDPLFFDRPEFVSHVEAAQVTALKRLLYLPPASFHKVMWDFLIDSGLYETFRDSLGMPDWRDYKHEKWVPQEGHFKL